MDILMREHRVSYRPLPRNIPGGVVVCIGRMSTADTPKLRLGFAIALVDYATFRTRPAGVAWIDRNDRHTCLLRLVLDERTQLTETPIVQAFPLLFIGLNPSSDMRQIFERNSERVAFSFGNDCLADCVVLVLLIPGLLAAHLLQAAFSGLRTDTLQHGAALGVSSAVRLDFSAVVPLAHAIDSDINDAHVDTENALWLHQPGIVEIADTAHVPLAAHEHKIDFAFAMLQQFSLMFTGKARNRFASTEEPDGNCVVGFKAKDSVVVRLRRVLAKCALGIMINFVGVCDFGDRTYRYLSRQLKLRTRKCHERLYQLRNRHFMIHEQGSTEWLLERVGHITSSRMKDVMDRTKKGLPTAKCESYKNELVYGQLTGNYVELGNFWQLTHGKELEPDARAHYALKMDANIKLAGFVRVDVDRLLSRDILLPMGGSPDGLIEEWIDKETGEITRGGIEAKCPQWENHVKWLSLQTVPEEHYPQCQSNMWICKADWWDFISYNPTFPVEQQLIVRRTYPDDEFIEQMLIDCASLSREVLETVERIQSISPVILTRPGPT